MDDSVGLAPPVESILAAARSRSGGESRLAVEARSLPESLARARSKGNAPVIAEVKPTSPTTEDERSVDPVAAAEAMESAGAAAISVLTEPAHFGGSTESLAAVRAAVSIPVLRKDFLLREAHLDAVAADVVLLIVRFLEDLEGMIAAARDRGMQPLVEVHTAAELREALEAGAEIIGVNNRDLGRLEVDRGQFGRLAEDIPGEVTAIAESGIETAAHARQMLDVGADGLLIGSAIMDGDIGTNTAKFVNA
jgi:indole-3-glycerol phosphate synthase